jgi:hypothetical protein
MQLLRELGRGRLKGEDQGVELTTNRKVYQLGESVVVRARFLHPLRLPIDRSRVSIRWSAPSGTSGTIELMRLPSHPDWFEAGFEPPYPGPYRISLSHPDFGKNAPAISIQINSGTGESAHHQRDQQALLSAARVSTGKLYEIDDVTRLVRDLPSAQPTRVESLPPQPLWNRPLWLLLLACGLFSEWFFRKKWHLG